MYHNEVEEKNQQQWGKLLSFVNQLFVEQQHHWSYINILCIIVQVFSLCSSFVKRIECNNIMSILNQSGRKFYFQNVIQHKCITIKCELRTNVCYLFRFVNLNWFFFFFSCSFHQHEIVRLKYFSNHVEKQVGYCQGLHF